MVKNLRSIEELAVDLFQDAQLFQYAVNFHDVFWDFGGDLNRKYPLVFPVVKRSAFDALISASGRLFDKSGFGLRTASQNGFVISLSLSNEISECAKFYDNKLLPWRHKVVAHRDARFSAEKASRKANLFPDDIPALAQNTAICVNRLLVENAPDDMVQKRAWMQRVQEDCAALRAETGQFVQAILK